MYALFLPFLYTLLDFVQTGGNGQRKTVLAAEGIERGRTENAMMVAGSYQPMGA